MRLDPRDDSSENDHDDDPSSARWGAFSYPNYRRYWFASLARWAGY